MAYSDIDSGKVLNKEGLLELSGQIKGYINTNIPQPYTLPTASTSTLGGVKVDGETITIEDGVISATSSGGGATYTAGSGIEIDENNVISNNMPLPTDLFFGVIYASLESSDSQLISQINGSFTFVANDADEFIDCAKKSVWFENRYGDNFTGAKYTNLKN